MTPRKTPGFDSDPPWREEWPVDTLGAKGQCHRSGRSWEVSCCVEETGEGSLSSNPSSATCRGAQPFGVYGPHWEKKSCLGPHIKCTVTCNHKSLIMF